jgi:hypothetical protein
LYSNGIRKNNIEAAEPQIEAAEQQRQQPLGRQ